MATIMLPSQLSAACRQAELPFSGQWSTTRLLHTAASFCSTSARWHDDSTLLSYQELLPSPVRSLRAKLALPVRVYLTGAIRKRALLQTELASLDAAGTGTYQRFLRAVILQIRRHLKSANIIE